MKQLKNLSITVMPAQAGIQFKGKLFTSIHRYNTKLFLDASLRWHDKREHKAFSKNCPVQRNLCLYFFIILSTAILTNCSWTGPSEEQPSHIKASLSEGKNNFAAGNYAVAYRQLLPPAVRGNKDAQYAVGYMYYYGKGIDCNVDLAENWLRKAANKGDSRARAMLKELNEHKIHPVQKKTEVETETEDNLEDE